MRKELEQKLARRWPNCFGLAGNPRLSPMPLGFQCGDGWYNIHLRLCADLEPLVAELEKETGGRFDVVQVKQKLGPLRFYASHHTDRIDERIAEAQGKSAHAHGAMS
jgi:hypothetical protein